MIRKLFDMAMTTMVGRAFRSAIYATIYSSVWILRHLRNCGSNSLRA